MSSDKKVILVTGGASGIGRATVDCLAQDKVHVVVADVQVTLAADVVAKVKQAGGSAEVCELNVAQAGAAAAAGPALAGRPRCAGPPCSWPGRSPPAGRSVCTAPVPDQPSHPVRPLITHNHRSRHSLRSRKNVM